MERGALVRDVIEASREFHKRRLWKRFTNDDRFVIRVAGAEDPSLACVMGAGGEQYGLMLFQGPHAAASFSLLSAGISPDDDTADDTDMLGFNLEAFGNLSSEAQAFFREAGIHPRHDEQVPDFLVKPPHHNPRLPNDAELALLVMALKGMVVADRRKLLKPSHLGDEDAISSLTLGGDAGSPTVTVTRERLPQRPRSAELFAAPASVPDLSGLKLLDASWLVGAPFCRNRIKDDDRSLRLLLVADADSDLLLHASAFFTQQIQEAIDRLVEIFHGRPPNDRPGVPRRIVFSSRKLHGTMAPALRKLGVKCTYKPVVAKLQALADGFDEFSSREARSLDERPEERGLGEGELPAPDDLAAWKRADRGLSERLADFLQDGDLLRSARAVRRYFDDDNLESFLSRHAERGVAMAYAAWGVLDFRPRKSSATQAERMLAEGLPPAQAMLLRARMEAHPTVYRVAGHNPRAGTVDLEDVLLGGAATVHDQLLSENIQDNLFLVLRVFPAGQFHFLELAGPPLGAGMGLEAVEFLRDCGLQFTPGGLKRGAHKLGWLWGWLDAWEPGAHLPRLSNTEGDPILLHTASFAVADPLETRQSLLRRDDIEYDEQEDEFTWLQDTGEAAERLGGSVTLGTIEFVGDELVLEVNSKRRFETARRWLTNLPGVTFRNVVTRSLASLAENPPLDERISKPAPEITPEMAAGLQELIDRQSMKWIDTPLPILGGKTPREACRTRTGRELVTTLIRTMPDPIGPAAVRVPRRAMLRELGIDT